MNAPVIDIDPAAFWADPYPTLARLRAGGQGYTDAMQRAAHAAAGWLDTRVVEQNYALKMLVHPWSQDPIFHAIGDSRARTAAVIKAHDAQVRALEKLAKVGGRKDPKRGNVMRILADFVRDSGLLDVTARSLGAQHHGYPFSG